MRIYLNVPYEEKDLAKRRGCWWDDFKKQWFIENPTNIQMFMRWMPDNLKVPTKSKPLKHEPFVNTKLSKDRIKRLLEDRKKKKTKR